MILFPVIHEKRNGTGDFYTPAILNNQQLKAAGIKLTTESRNTRQLMTCLLMRVLKVQTL